MCPLILIVLLINLHLTALMQPANCEQSPTSNPPQTPPSPALAVPLCPNSQPIKRQTRRDTTSPTANSNTNSNVRHDTSPSPSNNQTTGQANTNHSVTTNDGINYDTGVTTMMTSEQDLQNHNQMSLKELNNFRLEYNKYKILSHLSITQDVDRMAPEVNDDLRRELVSIKSAARKDQDLSSSNARHKRSLACDQVKGDKNACCLETFYVNFTYIGWDKWILYPAGYNANYCRGPCDLSNARYYHSTLLSKYSNVISLCCSPKQMAPLRLLYIDEDNKVHQKSIPDMIVEGCDCA